MHLANEVAYTRTLHGKWMFFLESFMKILKWCVRQKARLEGSLAEGWVVCESLYYTTKFLLPLNPSISRLWDDRNDPQVVGDVG